MSTTVTDRAILAAALRRHTANERRLEIGAEKRRLDKAVKVAYDSGSFKPPYGQNYRDACMVRDAAIVAAQLLTPARRKELAALRALAKVCASVRSDQQHATDADVIDVPMRLTHGLT